MCGRWAKSPHKGPLGITKGTARAPSGLAAPQPSLPALTRSRLGGTATTTTLPVPARAPPLQHRPCPLAHPSPSFLFRSMSPLHSTSPLPPLARYLGPVLELSLLKATCRSRLASCDSSGTTCAGVATVSSDVPHTMSYESYDAPPSRRGLPAALTSNKHPLTPPPPPLPPYGLTHPPPSHTLTCSSLLPTYLPLPAPHPCPLAPLNPSISPVAGSPAWIPA